MIDNSKFKLESKSFIAYNIQASNQSTIISLAGDPTIICNSFGNICGTELRNDQSIGCTITLTNYRNCTSPRLTTSLITSLTTAESLTSGARSTELPKITSSVMATSKANANGNPIDNLYSLSSGGLPGDHYWFTSTLTSSTVGAIAGGAAGIAILIIIEIIIVVIIALRRQKKKSPSNPQEEGEEIEIPIATAVVKTNSIPLLDNIVVDKKLGGGNYGEGRISQQILIHLFFSSPVYLGLWKGLKIAMKKLKNQEDLINFEKESSILFEIGAHPCIQFHSLHSLIV